MTARAIREPSLAKSMPVSFSPFQSGDVPTVEQLLGPLYTPEMRVAFPDVKPPYKPFGYLALVQLRVTPKVSKGGILLPDESIDTERQRSQSGLVRALGVSCFHDRQTGEEWWEKAWFRPGDFVRTPMYGGDRFDVDVSVVGKNEYVRFMFLKESDVIALVTGDPLTLKTS